MLCLIVFDERSGQLSIRSKKYVSVKEINKNLNNLPVMTKDFEISDPPQINFCGLVSECSSKTAHFKKLLVGGR